MSPVFIYLFIESVRGTEKEKKYIFLLMFLREQEKMKCQIYDILTWAYVTENR